MHSKDSPHKVKLPKIDDYRAIGRLITEIENGVLKFDEAMPSTSSTDLSRKIVIGVTGGSGVGKSTFINTLIRIALSEERKIAVLAIDPMSDIDRGTFLGDRLRFDDSYPEKGVFIRSISSSGSLNDLPESVASMLNFLEMTGYNFLIVETIGVGQSDAQIKMYTDKLIYIPSPDLEDWVQALKNEALINSDIIFVNYRGGNGEKRLMKTISQVIETRSKKPLNTVLLSGNAKVESDLTEVYNSLALLESN